MKFVIPRIGDQIELIKEWSFPLFREHRNNGMMSRVNPTIPPVTGVLQDQSILCKLPSGTVLKIITMANTRKGNCSVTFKVVEHPDDDKRPKYHQPENWYDFDELPTINPAPQKLKGAEFWARLSDIEKMEFDRK